MSDFEIIRTIKEDEVPRIVGRSKYHAVFKACSRLAKDEVLEVRIQKAGQVTSIAGGLARAFKHTKFKCIGRKKQDGYYCYIQRLN